MSGEHSTESSTIGDHTTLSREVDAIKRGCLQVFQHLDVWSTHRPTLGPTVTGFIPALVQAADYRSTSSQGVQGACPIYRKRSSKKITASIEGRHGTLEREWYRSARPDPLRILAPTDAFLPPVRAVSAIALANLRLAQDGRFPDLLLLSLAESAAIFFSAASRVALAFLSFISEVATTSDCFRTVACACCPPPATAMRPCDTPTRRRTLGYDHEGMRGQQLTTKPTFQMALGA